MTYEVKILADSISPAGCRLTTVQARFPRIVLVDFNTHRTLSRNGSSSRAIPVSKKASDVLADPFIPEQWLENKPGMQGGVPIEGWRNIAATAVWRGLVGTSVLGTKLLAALGVHKQWANRPLEPYSWQTAIISATEWENFLALRTHPDAQPEFQTLACLIRDALEGSKPTLIRADGWHFPLVPDIEQLKLKYNEFEIARISCARCARVSYLTHDGKIDPMKDLVLAKKLQDSGHMSPFEHAAIAGIDHRFHGNFMGWFQYRKLLAHESNYGAFLRSKVGQ